MHRIPLEDGRRRAVTALLACGCVCAATALRAQPALPAGDLAALYVASQFRLIGLEPAGEDRSYFQRVSLLRGIRERDGARFALTRDGRTTEFAFESDYLPGINYTAGEAELIAPMVFVGQAVHAPELKHEDFAGVYLRGKIAVVLDNAPARFHPDQRAHYASSLSKLTELERRGGVGVIFLGDPDNEKKRPWALDAPNWGRPGMRRLDAKGRPVDDFQGLRVRVAANVALAEAIFAGSPHTAAEVFAMIEAGTLRAFDLAGTATLASRARLDHLGIGAPHHGDAIYNGAQDNAVGVATMLEAARLLATAPSWPRRSMLFAALTAEEKGLLGSFHFVAQPTVPRGSLVANVNMDMPLLISDLTDVIPVGIEHSSLDSVARRAVAQAGLALTADPMPEEVLFVRSDQYAFVRAGVLAIYLLGGVKTSDGVDGQARLRDFLAQRYHLPGDDLSQPISWVGAARLARVNVGIGLAIGNDPARPEWKPGDFFGGMFAR